jgi:hypothetical protein
MAQIFTIEHEVPAPQFDFKLDKNFAGYQARVDVYLEDVKNKLKQYGYGKGPLFGEIIAFSVADGYACCICPLVTHGNTSGLNACS